MIFKLMERSLPYTFLKNISCFPQDARMLAHPPPQLFSSLDATILPTQHQPHQLLKALPNQHPSRKPPNFPYPWVITQLPSSLHNPPPATSYSMFYFLNNWTISNGLGKKVQMIFMLTKHQKMFSTQFPGLHQTIQNQLSNMEYSLK